MDDVYQINVAKTEFREAYNTGDIERLVSVFHDGCVNMSDGFASASGAAVRIRVRERAVALFADYAVRLVPIVIKILPFGDKMFDYGWHEFTLTPKAGGTPVRKRERYMEVWAKDTAGRWKILFYMNNADVRNELNGVLATWFLDQEPIPASA